MSRNLLLLLTVALLFDISKASWSWNEILSCCIGTRIGQGTSQGFQGCVQTQIEEAVRDNNTKTVRVLARFADLIDLDQVVTGTEGQTLAWIAASKGYTEIVQILDAERADLDKADKNGRTPVFIAASEGQTEVVKFLASRVDLNKADNEVQTPFSIAAYEGHIEIVKYLADKVNQNQADKYDRTPVFLAAYKGHIKIVKFLADTADLDRADDSKVTPVCVAASLGYTEIVRILAGKSDLNKVDRDKRGPLYFAVRYGYTEMVQILLEANAIVDKEVKKIIRSDDAEISVKVEIKQMIEKKLLQQTSSMN